MEGKLVPIGATDRFRGITGCLFRSDDLRPYRPVQLSPPPGGFLNYKEAARVLRTRSEVIRALVLHGVFSTTGDYQTGLAKLVPAREVQRFAGQYIEATALAKRLGCTNHRLGGFPRQAQVPLLDVPINGKGSKMFVLKKVAAKIRSSSAPSPITIR